MTPKKSTRLSSSSSTSSLPVLSPVKKLKKTKQNHDGSATITKSRDTATRRRRYRIALIVAQFLLTFPRWSWNLFLFCAHQSLPLPSLQQGLHQPIQRIQAVMQQQAAGYETCTTEYFSQTVQGLRNTTVQAETERVQKVQSLNQQTLESLDKTVHACEQTVATIRTVLSTWIQQQQVQTTTAGNSDVAASPTTSRSSSSSSLPIVSDPLQCSASDQQALMDWLGESTSLQRRQVLQLFDNYLEQSMASSIRLAQYSVDRATYDYDYFVGHKLDLGWLDQALRVPASDSFPEIPLLNTDLLDLLDTKVLTILNDAMVRVYLLEQRLFSFMASLAEFDVHYRDLYKRIVSASDFVRDFLPSGIPIPASLKLDGIPVADVLLPENFQVPHFDADLPDLVDVRIRYAAILRERLNQFRQEVSENVNDIMHQTMAQLRKVLEDKFTLEDYNPPLLDNGLNINQSIHEEIVDVQNMAEKTRASLDRSLRLGLLPNVDMEPPRSLPNVTMISPPDLEDKTKSVHFLQPEIPLIFLPGLLTAVVALFITHKWLIEIVIHCFRAWQLYRKFVLSSTSCPPKIIYSRQDEEHAYTETLLLRIQKTVIEHFVTPWMAFGLVLLPIAVIGTTLWLPHAKASCIDSTQGTLLARHIVAPILINQVMMNGNTRHMQNQLQCHRESERICLQAFMSFDETQRNHEKAFHEIRFEYESSRDSFRLVGNCIDSDDLQNRFERACCGLYSASEKCVDGANIDSCPLVNTTFEAQSVLSFTSLLSNEACAKDSATFYQRQDRFDCSELNGVCSDSPCSVVDMALLNDVIIAQECKIEVYSMKCCLSVLIALYHALMLNLCCTLIFNGIKQLWWRKTSTDGIELVTRMDEQGSLIRAGDCRERSARIARAIQRFELVGRIQLGLGYALFLVWFLSFFFFGRLLSKFR